MESGFVTQDDMLPMGHCQVLPPLCLLQAETAVVGRPQVLPCGSIGTVTMGQEPLVFLASPHSIQISNPCRQDQVILLDHPQQTTVLVRRGLPRSLHGFTWHQSSSGSMLLEDKVEDSTRQTHATSNSILPHTLTGKCKVGRGIIRIISENWEKYVLVDSNLPQCEVRFGEMTP